MDNWRLSDPEYTAFEPRTVQEAILKFRRLQKAGLDPWRYPETFVQCARKLPAEEVAKFESWIVTPQGEDPNAITLQEFKALPLYQPKARLELEDDEKTLTPMEPETDAAHL